MLLPSNSFGYRPIYHSSRVETIVIYLQNENARFEKGKEGRKKERKVEKITIYTHGAFLSLPLNAKLLQRKQNTYVQSRCNTVESIFRRVNSYSVYKTLVLVISPRPIIRAICLTRLNRD